MSELPPDIEQLIDHNVAQRVANVEANGLLPPPHFIRRKWANEDKDFYKEANDTIEAITSPLSAQDLYNTQVNASTVVLQGEYYFIYQKPDGIEGRYWIGANPQGHPFVHEEIPGQTYNYEQGYAIDFVYDPAISWKSQKFEATENRPAFAEVLGKLSVDEWSSWGSIHLQYDKRMYIQIGAHPLVIPFSQ